MQTLKTLILLTALVTGATVGAAECQPGKMTWVETDGSLMMALRSNACHFWSWSAQNSARLLPSDVLSYQGLVAGDAHHENFSHVFTGTKRVYVLNDMDDSGVAPFYLDFLKFLGVSRSVIRKEGDLSTEQMLKAYTAGVSGKRWSGGVPELLKEDAKVTAKQLADDYLEKIKNNTTDGLFDKKDGLIRWSEMSADQRRRFTALENKYFRAALPQGYEIKDRALFTKEGGGSGGMARYWFYLKKSSEERHLIEFKPVQPPAVAAYTAQPLTGVDRLQQVAAVYWGGALPEAFGPVGDRQNVFWMRPRLPGYIDFNARLFRDDPKGFAELSYYIAYRMGQWHGQQLRDSRYADLLTQRSRELTAASQTFIGVYLETAQSEQGSK